MLRWRLSGPLDRNFSAVCPNAVRYWQSGPLTLQLWPADQPGSLIVDYNGELTERRTSQSNGPAEFEYWAGNLEGHRAGHYEWRVIMRCYVGATGRQTLPVAEAVAYGAFWYDPSADTTPTPFQSPTPLPTETPFVDFDPYANHGPLSITRVVYQSTERDASRPNGALVYLRMAFSGGAAPYRVYDDGTLSLEAFVPSPSTGYALVFPAQAACGNDLAHTVRLESADLQQAEMTYFVAAVPCPL
jgi:hypothetical protein